MIFIIPCFIFRIVKDAKQDAPKTISLIGDKSMNKTMKKIAILAAAITLSSGFLFAQPRQAEFPNIQQEHRTGKLLGIVDAVTSNSLTFIDMDGKKVTVATTPFTDIQDIEKVYAVDPKAKDAREQMKRTYLSINQVHKGHWVDIRAFKTEGGKLVAEHISVIRYTSSEGEK